MDYESFPSSSWLAAAIFLQSSGNYIFSNFSISCGSLLSHLSQNPWMIMPLSLFISNNVHLGPASSVVSTSIILTIYLQNVCFFGIVDDKFLDGFDDELDR